MDSCNFSYKHYDEILQNFKNNGYKFGLFDQENKGKTVYLRHDLDHSIKKALPLSDIERAANARATYCLRFASPFDNLFYEENKSIIYKILDRGHDLALHYERESQDTAEKQLEILKKYFPIKDIISFHRPQDDVFNKKYKNFVNTYDQPFFGDLTYLSDSTGKWRSGCPCKHKEEGNYQILTHPVWWGREEGDACAHLHNFMRDKMYEWDQIYYDDNPFYTERLK